ncbi:formate C-acetyltransferase [Sporobacter termitidis DSM 10068]|uniref:Formate C-acetyltransferase n=1 Tax=Sporobacter termitidis DSM 10068 TaxID=1123282 RepID=A0A1M5YNB7_9FIRM|nr:pyruvate formate lyase family protein [Sporobacter termitidis]SHI13409.1 formate C-acetyltransferase [Sporobacter termitidis DSM 10068]
MYKLAPVTERVKKMREKYRGTQPEICTSRYRLITEFYMDNPDLTGILKRAKNFKNICENIAIRIDDGEVIVGAQSSKYRACALYPENSVIWLKEELESGYIMTRDIDPYIVSDEDRDYILSTVDFWMKECMSAKTDAAIIDEYKPIAANGVLLFGPRGQTMSPVGHFATGYNTAIRKGFAAIRAEAEAKKAELVGQGIPSRTIDQYNFYRAVSIVCDGMITLTKRYARLAAEMAAAEADPGRKKELETMAEVLDWCMEKPCRSFHEAVQCLFMYQTCLCLDANMHGMSFGRVDQYLGGFYDNDIKAGRLTPEYGQELLDLFYLKVAEMNKPWSYGATQSNPGYTSGQLMTMGGVDKDGNDASNAVTYMMLQTAGRLVLHDPPQALRIHKNTPPELWEAAIETTKLAGGVPTFENDEVIIPALMARGLSLEDARNCTLIGCVEPAGCGTEWPCCGGTGTESYMNLAAALWIAINDGYNPMPPLMTDSMAEAAKLKASETRVGLPTGHLYDMKSFEEVKEAFKKQIEFFVKWHHMNINSFEYVAREVLPNPVVSCTMAGCMEKGMDVMWGGAKYNSTGNSGVGIGNVADSLNIIRHCVFEKKVCTARELYDAILNNWEGFEDLHRYILNEAPHYGNGIAEADALAGWAAKVFADAVRATSGPRGNRSSAGLYPVTTNVMFGQMTAATPDGRYKGEPLADGIAAPQGYDKNGPTAIIASISQIKQTDFANGTLMNLKFHPTALAGEDGWKKLMQLMQTYFDLGGMELQINVISTGVLRDAQKNPDKHKDLVVRVAGFSAYFVELHISGQNDLIKRTELAM